MGKLQDQVAVITGGTRGLGFAIAEAYARAGAKVVVASRSAESVRQAVQNLQQAGAAATGLAGDVARLEAMEALSAHALKTYGRLDVWVNNAGLSAPYGPTAHIPPAQFTAAVNTIVFGTYHGSIVALRHFLAERHGKLINLVGAGERRPVPFQNAYASSKIWVRSFTLALAQEYARTGVGIFAFQPGLVVTELLTAPSVIRGYEARLDRFPDVIRLLAKTPAEAAQKALWIASSATDGRTGLAVDAAPMPELLGRALLNLLRQVGRPPAPRIQLNITSVAPALPPLRQ
jgi:NAD(P)-dependent dehydrogenase (short-subunit alcohol dehydrogenase family)